MYAREDGIRPEVATGIEEVLSVAFGYSSFRADFLPTHAVRREDRTEFLAEFKPVGSIPPVRSLDFGLSIPVIRYSEPEQQFVSFLPFDHREDQLPITQVATSNRLFDDDVVQVLDLVSCEEFDECRLWGDLVPIATSHRVVFADSPTLRSSLVAFLPDIRMGNNGVHCAEVSDVDYIRGQLITKRPFYLPFVEAAQAFGFACRNEPQPGLYDCLVAVSSRDDYDHNIVVRGLTLHGYSGGVPQYEFGEPVHFPWPTAQDIAVWYNQDFELFFMAYVEAEVGNQLVAWESPDGERWSTVLLQNFATRLSPEVGSAWVYSENQLTYAR